MSRSIAGLNRHVRLERDCGLYRLAAIADFGDHFPRRLFFHQLQQPMTHQRVVVAKQ